MDPLDTETSRFWENFGPQNPSDPAKIQTEVFQLPTTCFAEENGSLVNSARWLQWHFKAADPPGDAQSDILIMSGIFHRLREMYRKEGGAFPDPLLNLTWNYTNPADPDPEDLAKEMNGRALTDLKDPTRRGDPARRTIARRLRAAPRRRDHGLRLLDLCGVLHRARQHDGASRRDRPARARHRAELGLGVARESPDPVQPRERRSGRQALESGEARHRMGRQPLGRASTRPTTRPRPSPPTPWVRSS